MNIEKYLIRLLEFKSDKYAYLKHLPKHSRVLDIGCGDCRRIRYRSYFRDDLQYYGIDLGENERCRSFLKEFHRLDILRENLPFAKEFFNLVTMSHVIEHLPKDKFLIALQNIKRVLKPGGYIYIEFPSERTLNLIRGEILRRYSLPVNTFNFYDDETHISKYSLEELTAILAANGFHTFKYGDIREPVKKLLSPLLLFWGYVKRDESIFTGVLWSLVDWASYVIVKKN